MFPSAWGTGCPSVCSMFHGTDAESGRWISRDWWKQGCEKKVGGHIKSSWHHTWNNKQEREGLALSLKDGGLILTHMMEYTICMDPYGHGPILRAIWGSLSFPKTLKHELQPFSAKLSHCIKSLNHWSPCLTCRISKTCRGNCYILWQVLG